MKKVSSQKKRSFRISRIQESPWLYLAPFFVLFLLFKIGPIISNFVISLYQLDIVGAGKFIGVKNYSRLLADKLFWIALRNTFSYLAMVGPINVIGGFFLALLLNQPLRGRGFTRAVIFLPYVIMVTVVGALWRWILEGNYGILNHYLQKFFNIESIFWLTTSSTAMVGVVLASVWWTIGYNTVIFLAGLQDVPKELMEAAEIDGAGPLRRLVHVTIPCLRSTSFFVVLTTIIYSLQVFGQVYTMTGGGPNYSTLVLVQHLYISGFRLFKLGYSSTISVVLFIVIFLISLGVFRVNKQTAG
ncbi:MAG: sugar ABC transporter permease [Candidatus Atribacteria bacterium]|nr:sugar ABC transporter permease [Candidatus Atribacteria bacterium]